MNVVKLHPEVTNDLIALKAMDEDAYNEAKGLIHSLSRNDKIGIELEDKNGMDLRRNRKIYFGDESQYRIVWCSRSRSRKPLFSSGCFTLKHIQIRHIGIACAWRV